jgi:hypothetical protein
LAAKDRNGSSTPDFGRRHPSVERRSARDSDHKFEALLLDDLVGAGEQRRQHP